jgi:putative colanic acid biosysnthesis UDP-glucose lipid carrier transferase
MKEKYQEIVIKFLIYIIDFWLINIAFTVTADLGLTHGSNDPAEVTSFFLIFILIWIIAGFFFDVHRLDCVSLTRSISVNLMATFLVHMAMISIILMSFSIFNVQGKFLVLVYLMAGVFIIGSRVLYKLIVKYIEFSAFDKRKIIIIGATGSGMALQRFFHTHHGAGYEFRGFFDDRPPKECFCGNLIAGKLDEVKKFCMREKIDEIYFTLPPTCKDLLEDLLKFADDNFIYFRIAPDFGKFSQGRCNLFLMNSIPVLTATQGPAQVSVTVTVKRALDILFSLAVILTVFPLLCPLIALCIRLESGGPVISKQLRPGMRNRLFDCYTFRTVHINHDGGVQMKKHEARTTRVGALLRRTNLDRLPQFFNVLLGNMTVTGLIPWRLRQPEKNSHTIEHFGARTLEHGWNQRDLQGPNTVRAQT